MQTDISSDSGYSGGTRCDAYSAGIMAQTLVPQGDPENVFFPAETFLNSRSSAPAPEHGPVTLAIAPDDFRAFVAMAPGGWAAMPFWRSVSYIVVLGDVTYYCPELVHLKHSQHHLKFVWPVNVASIAHLGAVEVDIKARGHPCDVVMLEWEGLDWMDVDWRIEELGVGMPFWLMIHDRLRKPFWSATSALSRHICQTAARVVYTVSALKPEDRACVNHQVSKICFNMDIPLAKTLLLLPNDVPDSGEPGSDWSVVRQAHRVFGLIFQDVRRFDFETYSPAHGFLSMLMQLRDMPTEI